MGSVQVLSKWMESILLGHIYHMINNDSSTGHIIKNNHRPRDPKEPIGNAYQAMHINKNVTVTSYCIQRIVRNYNSCCDYQ
jgi:hypothetical protein